MVDKELLTTTEAAKLLAVSPDTVLKWVRAKKIKSYRTPGRHSRIPRSEITALLAKQSANQAAAKPKEEKIHQYCWEYISTGGEIKEECKECITYKSRAVRCYELRDLPGDLGCLRLDCELSCSDCSYYRLVSGLKLNVLIISGNKKLLADREKLNGNKNLHIKFVENEYYCSFEIENFRPDYIVVDVSYGKERTAAFCNYLFNDPRIPVVRILLASKSENLQEYCDKEIFGWIRKPFTLQQLQNCIDGVSS